MSHLPERKEKICLNCNAALEGRFCHVCGQENIEPREGFWHLVMHFTFDLFHFDGKFLSSLRYLLFKPGFLSQEHLRGRRADYLHPIRMYIFTSAFFFLMYFTFFQKGNPEIIKADDRPRSVKAKEMLARSKKRLERTIKLSDSSTNKKTIDSIRQVLVAINADSILLSTDTSFVTQLSTIDTTAFSNEVIQFSDDSIKYTSLKTYDSIQQTRPKEKRDGFILSIFQRKLLDLKEKYNNDNRKIYQAISAKFIQLLPSLMFCSLPIYALVLTLLYWRRKTFFYVDHIVYTIHLYCAIFIIVLFSFVASAGVGYLWKPGSTYLEVFMSLIGLFYWYKSMRNFYHQSRVKTIFKFLLLFSVNFVLTAFLFILFLIGSLLTVH